MKKIEYYVLSTILLLSGCSDIYTSSFNSSNVNNWVKDENIILLKRGKLHPLEYATLGEFLASPSTEIATRQSIDIGWAECWNLLPFFLSSKV